MNHLIAHGENLCVQMDALHKAASSLKWLCMYKDSEKLKGVVQDEETMKSVRALAETHPHQVKMLKEYAYQILNEFSKDYSTVGYLQHLLAHCIV
jgi:hypothetical protein